MDPLATGGDLYRWPSASRLDDLNILPATVNPRATQTMPQIIRMIEGLIDKGFAYPAKNGDVYFRVTKDPDYGKLSGRKLEDMQAGARIDIEEQKETPDGLRPVEGRQAGRTRLGQPVGPRPPRLAHRVLGHEPEPSWASRSTSTAAATT